MGAAPEKSPFDSRVRSLRAFASLLAVGRASLLLETYLISDGWPAMSERSESNGAMGI